LQLTRELRICAGFAGASYLIPLQLNLGVIPQPDIHNQRTSTVVRGRAYVLERVLEAVSVFPVECLPMQLRQFVFAVALAAIGGVPLSAQTVGAPGVSGARGANPKDVESVDAIISALYDANSLLLSPGRDTARFRSLFLAGARLMPVISMPAGAPILATRSIDDYIHGVARIPSRTGFREREISRTSQAFGNIVHVFSTYETRRDTADRAIPRETLRAAAGRLRRWQRIPPRVRRRP